jgi:hypothetical protein
MYLEKITFEIYDAIKDLDLESQLEVEKILTNLVRLLNAQSSTPAHRNRLVAQLSTYLQKKADDAVNISTAREHLNLRRVRNEVAHGRYRRDAEYTSLYPALWKAIAKLAAKNGPFDVENLLSYAMRIENVGIAQRGASPAKVVSVYKPIFNSFPEKMKNDIFVELLLRLFSEPTAIALLDNEEEK